jgi:hypothetical protein
MKAVFFNKSTNLKQVKKKEKTTDLGRSGQNGMK